MDHAAVSAKLNLFFGVRNLSEAFLPPHLKYLQSFFRRRPMNALLPAGGGSRHRGGRGCWCTGRAGPARPPASRAGWWLVATLLALAILEHWLLVLPLESTALWRWAHARSRQRPRTAAPPAPTNEDVLLHAR